MAPAASITLKAMERAKPGSMATQAKVASAPMASSTIMPAAPTTTRSQRERKPEAAEASI